ncbi:MAG: LuxR family transcriptional regulator [Nitrospirae bacterium]|nr:MAG: LuxR family transcriptional regulator [Nitrospirota bacterium]
MRVAHDAPRGDAKRIFPCLVARPGQCPNDSDRPEGADACAVKVMELCSGRDIERFGACNECCRRLGRRFHLAVDFFPPGPVRVVAALQRFQRDFSARNRQMLRLISPHFAQALQTARAFAGLRDQLETVSFALTQSAQGVVALNAGGEVLWMTDGCENWLRTYFAGGSRGRQGGLPALVQDWLAESAQAAKDEDRAGTPQHPLVLEGPNGWLTIRSSRKPDGQVQLLLSEERKDPAELGEAFGLTRRESEVARWVAHGKSNPEIAIILDISPRTVHKHVEHILAKLGVENRAGIILELAHHAEP